MLINSAEEIIGADAYGHTSAPSPHVLELSADVSRSAPSSLHVLKCGPAVTTCASGDDLTDLYVHAAFSPRITEVNYSADYSLEVDVYVAPGTSAWNMVILDDGRARVDLGSSGPGYVLSLVGSNGAWTRSIGSGWHSILIFYRPAQGIYRAAVDGTSVGPGASIGFVGGPPAPPLPPAPRGPRAAPDPAAPRLEPEPGGLLPGRPPVLRLGREPPLAGHVRRRGRERLVVHPRPAAGVPVPQQPPGLGPRPPGGRPLVRRRGPEALVRGRGRRPDDGRLPDVPDRGDGRGGAPRRHPRVDGLPRAPGGR